MLISKYISYGDCSSMVERTVVVRKTWVQFPPFAYAINGARQIKW